MGVAVLSIVPIILVLLAHLGDVVAGPVLLGLRPAHSISAVPALAGFGLLLARDIPGLVGVPLINLLVDRTTFGVHLAASGVGCCRSVIDVAATVFLNAAGWGALSAAPGQGTG